MASSGLEVIYDDFYKNHGRAFQVKCFEWLNFLYPELRDAKDLGEVDREGVDLYIPGNDHASYLKVYQCKGFEKAFGESQLAQCFSSIQSFIKSKSVTQDYFLIINVSIDGEYYNQLNDRLNLLKTSGKVVNAHLLTTRTFIKYYENIFVEYSLKKIMESNYKFYESYTTKMDHKFYIESVPFSVNTDRRRSPISYIWKRCKNNVHQEKVTSQFAKGKYFFLISDFGFGKTTLLLQLFLKSLKERYIPIYLPVSVLDRNSFGSTSNLCKDIFNVITSLDLDKKDKFLKFAGEAIKTLLKNKPNVLLLFDGLDEHLAFYKIGGLERLFNCTIELKSPCFFSFRKSFWEERFEDFEMAIPKNRKVKDKIFLSEWSNKEIIEYTNRYIELSAPKLNSSDIKSLDNFRLIIRSNNYSKYYGDIPKRPLFLEMIIRDVIDDRIAKKNISELYLNYFFQKFKRDILGQFNSFHPERELPDQSIDSLKFQLLEIHDEISETCLKKLNIEKGVITITNVINEMDIRPIIKNRSFSDDIAKFLMVSLLVTIDKRGNQYLKMRFAHTSFLEFFIARSLSKEIFSDIDTAFFHTSCKFNESIISFVKGNVLMMCKEIGKKKVMDVIKKKKKAFPQSSIIKELENEFRPREKFSK